MLAKPSNEASYEDCTGRSKILPYLTTCTFPLQCMGKLKHHFGTWAIKRQAGYFTLEEPQHISARGRLMHVFIIHSAVILSLLS